MPVLKGLYQVLTDFAYIILFFEYVLIFHECILYDSRFVVLLDSCHFNIIVK